MLLDQMKRYVSQYMNEYDLRVSQVLSHAEVKQVCYTRFNYYKTSMYFKKSYSKYFTVRVKTIEH
jgi:hypothetical protein